MRASWRRFLIVIPGLAVAGSAGATLLVHEPFDYEAGTVLDGTPAGGLNLSGSYVPLGPSSFQKLVVSSPGLDYGNLVGAPAAAGNRAQDSDGVTPASGTVAVAQPMLVPAGSALYWSALFVFDDSANGNRFANVTLSDAGTGSSIGFGETAVGVRALRVFAETAATGGFVAEGADGAFVDGETLLLIGRYVNGAAPGGDRLDLVGYAATDADVLPSFFDLSDPQAELSFSLSGLDVDLERITTIEFAIRGGPASAIDELRIGDSYASVVVPEPAALVALLLGVTGLAAGRSRFR